MSLEVQINDLLRRLLLKDLRIQCRARSLPPGGSRDALLERVMENMLETGDLTLAHEFNGEAAPSIAPPGTGAPACGDHVGNNYSRPDGQNCGNFLTDRPSSRVLAPPGGKVSFSFGSDANVDAPAGALIPAKRSGGAPASTAATAADIHSAAAEPAAAKVDIFGQSSGASGNNYTRPSGQNTGNFLTDRPSSRVLGRGSTPGGQSSIIFG